MTDATDMNTQAGGEENQSSANDTSDKDSIIADLQRQLQAVSAKKDELLSEAKKAKMTARQESEDKARAEGNYKQLLESSEKDRAELKRQLEELSTKISSEKIKTSSLSIANKIAADGDTAELLSEFISKRLTYTEGEIKVLDSSGKLTISKLEDLEKEILSDKKYASLVKGSKAAGGGAGSNNKSSVSENNVKTITMSEFNSLNPTQKMEKMKQGFRTVPD